MFTTVGCLFKKLHSWSLAWKMNDNLYTGLTHSRTLICVLVLPVERLRSSCLLRSQVLKCNCEAWESLKGTEHYRGEITRPFLYGYPSLCLYKLSITAAQQAALWNHRWSLQSIRAFPAGSYICPGILGAWRRCMNVHTCKNFLECFLGRDLAGTQVYGCNPTQKILLGVWTSCHCNSAEIVHDQEYRRVKPEMKQMASVLH